MADIYFPGCHYTLHSPQNSRKIRDWLRKKHGIRPLGCCSVHLDRIRPNDRAIYVCPTCGAFIDEYAPQAEGLSVWEILENDDAFPWPDCRGEKMSVQDCWRMRENRSLQKAVRAILRRMNIETAEIARAFNKTDFCGISLFKPASPRYAKFAPLRFIENAGDKFVALPDAEKRERMTRHCRQFGTEKVVCYCTGCLEGLQLGGAKGIHLMDLVAAAL